MTSKNRKRFYDKVNKHGPYPDQKKYPKLESRCHVWTGCLRNGYGAFSYKGKTCYAHILAWKNKRGKLPKGLLVLHKCDNPPCVNDDHLFIGDDAANARDKKRKGRAPRGSAIISSKLTECKVAKIRKMYNTGNYYQKDLAEYFYISVPTISMVVNYKIWQHVE